MKTARIVIGANYGDEGKGTVVAHYTKHSEGKVLNILTNGGAQRGHSILTENDSITFQHFGSGTYHGADSYFSRFFILNPIQFVREYETLFVKPDYIYRDKECRWSTPYDGMANLIQEEQLHRKASCGMGIWNTIKRYQLMPTMTLDDFLSMETPITYLNQVKAYYERFLTIPDKWKGVWNSKNLQEHFWRDCLFLKMHTIVVPLSALKDYTELIFENGQGLLLCDTGKDTYDTTPSHTGIKYAKELLMDIPDVDITAHYVTRPYITRHGDGDIMLSCHRKELSSGVQEDRTNQYNEYQGEFRYGALDISELKNRILTDTQNTKFQVEVTHCDEMDREIEFKHQFQKVNCYDSALIK